MYKIDVSLYEGRQHELITNCTACGLSIRKGREAEFRWKRCRYEVGKLPIGYKRMEEIAYFCTRCISEFVDRNDAETNQQLQREMKNNPSTPGRPVGTINGGCDKYRDWETNKRKKAKKKKNGK